ncbi:hypothetical protein J6590_057451 [Homalodisca vitripennis]|nr:hypothetical protein J6590_057451 [Homalodisca vitripennis]
MLTRLYCDRRRNGGKQIMDYDILHRTKPALIRYIGLRQSQSRLTRRICGRRPEPRPVDVGQGWALSRVAQGRVLSAAAGHREMSTIQM